MTVRNGRAHAYTPPDTVAYERSVAAAWRSSGGERIPKGTAVEVEITVCKDRAEVTVTPVDGVPVTARADLDNIAKAILDGLIGVAYDDDRQVARLTVRRAA